MNFVASIYNGSAKIKNIIFDWGGVITDLHFEKTKNAFIQLGITFYHESVPHDPYNDLFTSFEIGKINPEEFRNRIRDKCNKNLTDLLIDQAWNAMLGELPQERWNILDRASKKYRTFLLSNTNAIHLPYYFTRIKEMYGTDGYTHFFEKTYYSHILGMRKPNADIFEYVLRDAGIMASETMFIDDFSENIETAAKLGFQTIHLKAPYTLVDVFETEL